ncbi:proton channel OtopLc isoform X3 [Onthophagus taurus]|uniref:proton channel OtopLc isoform X3 n=1 Tax=Onthophagus taurus TaxID=166361 RepID=UPI0039BE90D6
MSKRVTIVENGTRRHTKEEEEEEYSRDTGREEADNRANKERFQEIQKCKVKIYKLSNMQRCPYIHEMKERLLGEQIPMEVLPKKIPDPPPLIMDQQPVATVVKLNSDGYGSHTSPTHRTDRVPLMPKSSDEDLDCGEKKYHPKNAKTSLFIIMSFVYAKLLIVVCLAYVISDVVTHSIPLWYYEGFFTYLYGMSILFLLYVFCFLLQESTCCSGEPKKEKVCKKQAKEKALKEKEKKKEEKEKKKEEKEKKKEKKDDKKDKDKDKKTKKQEKSTYRRNSEGVVDAGLSGGAPVPVPVTELEAEIEQRAVGPQEQQQTAIVQPNNGADLELGISKTRRKRKTTQNDQSHGSFFLRIGAIAFGLGTMIYTGLEFGSFFEVPFESPCYMILHGVNPALQMVFTFMQMYFIFMNSRLNIHRFKVIARFGLMHVFATNICVWIRTLVLEYMKEITVYHKKFDDKSGQNIIADSIRSHNLRNANTVLRTHVAIPDVIITTASTILSTLNTTAQDITSTTAKIVSTTVKSIPMTLPTIPTTTERFTIPSTIPTTLYRMYRTIPTTFKTSTTTTIPTTTRPTTIPFIFSTTSTVPITLPTSAATTTTTAARFWDAITSSLSTSTYKSFLNYRNFNFENNIANVAEDSLNINGSEVIDELFPQALIWNGNGNGNSSLSENISLVAASCKRVNIMGTIVQDSAPYLYPFIIEYSLIGAAVIYVMWKHIGRHPKYITEEDLEHRLEVMLSRRAVALAHAQQGRVDCVGASKGLFFGLLLLVGSLICLILYFVMINHRDFGMLAVYLADVSHCVVMALSIIAIIVGFIRTRKMKSDLNFRVQSLKFRIEEQNDLNDILLRVSAFGLFLYATFTVIAGTLKPTTREPNMLIMMTGTLAIVQVLLQLLFIADVSRRRVHLPEHDRSKPGRQVVTFLLICNITMWIIYTFEMKKVEANPIIPRFYGFLAWAFIQRLTLPLCIFHRFHSAVTLAEIWKTSYKARIE